MRVDCRYSFFCYHFMTLMFFLGQFTRLECDLTGVLETFHNVRDSFTAVMFLGMVVNTQDSISWGSTDWMHSWLRECSQNQRLPHCHEDRFILLPKSRLFLGLTFFQMINHRIVQIDPLQKTEKVGCDAGILAAEAAHEALSSMENPNMDAYWEALQHSWVWQELYSVRNIRPVCPSDPSHSIQELSCILYGVLQLAQG